jgi:hypothetical protein
MAAESLKGALIFNVPYRFLETNVQYSFSGTVTNFLGVSSHEAPMKRRDVSILNLAKTVVQFQGSQIVRMQRSDLLDVQADAFFPTCDGALDRRGLSFQFSVSLDGLILSQFKSSSRNPKRFVLPRYSLEAGKTYEVILTVIRGAASDNPDSTTASIEVVVGYGRVVTVVNGGDFRSLRAGTTIVLDASNSFDEDKQGVVGPSAGISYAYSCQQIFPTMAVDCPGIILRVLRAPFGYGEKVQATYSSLGSGRKSIITVTTRVGTRSSSKSVVVEGVSAATPVVNFRANKKAGSGFDLSKVNVNSRSDVYALVDAAVTGTASWTLDNFDLLDITSLEPVTSTTRAIPAGSAIPINLGIPAGKLDSGATYRFRLTVILASGEAGSAYVDISTNSPPTPGTFACSPTTGTELTTVFSMQALAWSDIDSPLHYSIVYHRAYPPIGDETDEVTLTSKGGLSRTTSNLPGGSQPNGFRRQVSVYVFDSLGAAAKRSTVLVVNPLPITDRLAELEAAVDAENTIVDGTTSETSTSEVTAGDASEKVK